MQNCTTSASCRAKRHAFGSAATFDSTIPTLDREQKLWSEGHEWVAGLDEVGRGPLAGPVVAAAVVFPIDGGLIDGLRDSKQLTAKRREELSTLIKGHVRAWGVGAASVREVDRRNILSATGLAMRRALAHLPKQPDRILVDGTALPELQFNHDAIIKGDSVSQSIAAASILAKCVRDRLMTLLAGHYPAFHWDSNMGYGTADHYEAIKKWGPTAHHRKSFAPIGQFSLDL